MKIKRADTENEVHQRLAENIRARRERLKLSQAQLAAAAGFAAPQTISDIERGMREVKVHELAALARALYSDMMDLFGAPELPTLVAWRNKPETGAEASAARFLQLCEYYREIEEWTHQPSTPNLPPILLPEGQPTIEWAETCAEHVRDWLGLGSLPAAALLTTLEEQSRVKLFHLPDLRGSAACAVGAFGAAIALNATEVPWRRNFSLAHELFHLLTWDMLHPDTGTSSNVTWPARTEMLAEAFASALLLPAEAVLERVRAARSQPEQHQVPMQQLIEVAREFDVSTAALLWRLVSLRLLKRARAQEILENPAFVAADRASFKPTQPAEELPSRYLRLLTRAYFAGEVSMGRVAEMSGQALADVFEWLAELEEEEAGAQQLVRLA